MKNLIAILALVISASTAYATEETMTEECIAQTPTGQTIALYLLPGDARSIESDSEEEQSKWVNFEGISYGNNIPKYAAIVLNVIQETIVTRDIIDDGCLQGHRWDSVRLAKVTKVSAYLPKSKGIKVGQTLRFACTTTVQAPTGLDCH
ncbi:hypothetical protein DOM22_06165 [Bdellovibrio sp. ZAP7]|uniref:hypothetical protein n=1 Tax=Bdellovibrio sp. ZAP7 TaxID=2231053 RepID=UPI00115ADE43|nr:hypothetical protein [Bdellovibrio sp. ZAP7]QDK44777.1 hypothetical protein DOM22_06165 [Bdellovibrio sp. ZAP7]